eukprot:359819-Chlamydomonas_euryale.AAC.2
MPHRLSPPALPAPSPLDPTLFLPASSAPGPFDPTLFLPASSAPGPLDPTLFLPASSAPGPLTPTLCPSTIPPRHEASAHLHPVCLDRNKCNLEPQMKAIFKATQLKPRMQTNLECKPPMQPDVKNPECTHTTHPELSHSSHPGV